jgi:hypothetical protein
MGFHQKVSGMRLLYRYGLRVDGDVEREGLDLAIHGEAVQ